MTLACVEALVWYYQSTTQFHLDTNVGVSAEGYLLNNDLISEFPSGYIITERGKALVEHWVNCPLPVATWMVPR
jgi:hypothetical protein